jgi:DNA-binding MarR family transcriptional regulator
LEKEPIGKLISHFHRQNQKQLVKKFLPYGIGSGGQHSFLKLILSKPGITQDQLTSELKFDKATTARSVKQLENSGYIERKPDPHDRRSHLLYPTSKAIDFLPVLQSILDEYNKSLVGKLTHEEVEQLRHLLQKISTNDE